MLDLAVSQNKLFAKEYLLKPTIWDRTIYGIVAHDLLRKNFQVYVNFTTLVLKTLTGFWIYILKTKWKKKKPAEVHFFLTGGSKFLGYNNLKHDIFWRPPTNKQLPKIYTFQESSTGSLKTWRNELPILPLFWLTAMGTGRAPRSSQLTVFYLHLV